MSSIFDVLSSALSEAMRQPNAPAQSAQSQMREPEPEQVQTGRPASAPASFSGILVSSGFGNLAGLVDQLSKGGLDHRSNLGSATEKTHLSTPISCATRLAIIPCRISASRLAFRRSASWQFWRNICPQLSTRRAQMESSKTRTKARNISLAQTPV